MSHAQQKVENRNIFWFNVVELQCNQVDDWLGAPPEIPVIFGTYVYLGVSKGTHSMYLQNLTHGYVEMNPSIELLNVSFTYSVS